MGSPPPSTEIDGRGEGRGSRSGSSVITVSDGRSVSICAGIDFQRRLECLVQQYGTEDFRGRPLRQYLPILDKEKMITEDRGKVEVMDRSDDSGAPFASFAPDAIEHVKLMADVQMCVGLVKQIDQRRLRQCAGQDRSLKLPSGKAGDRLSTKVSKIHQRNGVLGRLDVLRSLESSKTVTVGDSPEENCLLNGEFENRTMRLRDVDDFPTPTIRRHPCKWLAIQEDRAGIRGEQAADDSHRSRLSRPVSADDPDEFPGAHADPLQAQRKRGSIPESNISGVKKHIPMAHRRRRASTFPHAAVGAGQSYTNEGGMKNVIASIDIGGTKLAVGIADPESIAVDGALAATCREPIGMPGTPDVVIPRAVDLIAKLATDHDSVIRAIGISIGGPLDHVDGVVLNFPHLPGWRNIPLRSMLSELLDAPAFLDNDANLGALAEHRLGAARGLPDMVYVTISSGIGGGVIIDGRLLHGVGSGAGEIGHVTVAPDGPICPCGNRGCLEIMASGRSIARRGRETVAREPERGRNLLQRAGNAPSNITAELIADGLGAGDPLCADLWEETAEYLAIGLGSVIHVVSPRMIVLGGGVAATGERLLEPVRRRLRNHVFYIPIDRIQVKMAEFGQESPLLGAALLAADEVGHI